MQAQGPLRSLMSSLWTLPGGFGTFFLAGVVVLFSYNPDRAAQPIAFNHAKHIENGLTCTDCHVGAQAEQRATLPTISDCLTCHETALTKGSEEQKIRDLAAAGKELEWVQLTRMPAHVYFSHRRHVALAGMACADCHGLMEKAVRPPEKPFRRLTMDECIECHEQKKARTDCNDCHL